MGVNIPSKDHERFLGLHVEMCLHIYSSGAHDASFFDLDLTLDFWRCRVLTEYTVACG